MARVITGVRVNSIPVKPEPSFGMTLKISRLGITSDRTDEIR